MCVNLKKMLKWQRCKCRNCSKSKWGSSIPWLLCAFGPVRTCERNLWSDEKVGRFIFEPSPWAGSHVCWTCRKLSMRVQNVGMGIEFLGRWVFGEDRRKYSYCAPRRPNTRRGKWCSRFPRNAHIRCRRAPSATHRAPAARRRKSSSVCKWWGRSLPDKATLLTRECRSFSPDSYASYSRLLQSLHSQTISFVPKRSWKA